MIDMMKSRAGSLSSALAGAMVAMALAATPASAQERTITIPGFGAKSGVLRVFGVNSEAAMKAAAEKINNEGGLELGDGATGKFAIEYLDDRCVAEEGISVVRRIASGSAIIAVGPTCSNVAESLFGVLQKKVGDASDTGLQFPIIADVAAKDGLAQISDWSFRNVPSEYEMYKVLFGWLRENHPDVTTVYGGVEKDFAHSNATFGVMKKHAAAHGFELAGETEWLLADTNFSNQVRGMRRADPEVVLVSAHPFTTCGVLKEMARQRVTPKILVGLTSSSSIETMHGCATEAEGIIIPTGFAPVNEKATAAAEAVAAFGGSADIHSMAAYEIMFMLKEVIETQGIVGLPETVAEDRMRMRNGLAELKKADGLLGELGRTDDGEAIKPFLFVHAQGGEWKVLHDPEN